MDSPPEARREKRKERGEKKTDGKKYAQNESAGE